MKIALALFIFISGSVLAGDGIEFFRNETLESCYSKNMSAAVQNCMIYLADRKKAEYEKAFDYFITKIKKSKGDFHNYDNFLQSARETKKRWDLYIKEECVSQAYLDEKESFAFYTDNNACLIKAYSQRIDYYNKYQF